MTDKLLIPVEVLQALIDGKPVEFKSKEEDEWSPFTSRELIADLLDDCWDFRLAQEKEMITIGDVSFPKSVSKSLEHDTVYYIPCLYSQSLYEALIWGDDNKDLELFARNMVHLSKENAIAHAKALIALSGGDYGTD